MKTKRIYIELFIVVFRAILIKKLSLFFLRLFKKLASTITDDLIKFLFLFLLRKLICLLFEIDLFK